MVSAELPLGLELALWIVTLTFFFLLVIMSITTAYPTTRNGMRIRVSIMAAFTVALIVCFLCIFIIEKGMMPKPLIPILIVDIFLCIIAEKTRRNFRVQCKL
jgi:hypothetical protein